MVIQRFEVYLVNLDPTVGGEIQKTRPCVIVSPDEINRAINTIIIAPLTTGSRNYPSRVAYEFDGKSGHIVLDQIRVVSKQRLIKHLGTLDGETQIQVLATLAEMFKP